MENNIQIFENKKIRTARDSEHEEWYFSVVDVVSVLTDSVDGRKYWNKLKQRLKDEGNETVTNCHQLKMTAADGNNIANFAHHTVNTLTQSRAVQTMACTSRRRED